MISAGRAARALLFAIIVLTAGSLFVSLNRQMLVDQKQGQFYRLLAMDEEGNLPAWFSASLLLCCAMRLRYITWERDGVGDPDASYWRVLSLVFIFLSLDEIASIHEMATEPMRHLLDARGPFYFAWVIPGLGVIGLFVAIYSRFLLRLPRRLAVLFVSAGAVYVTGAIGFEMLGGWYGSSHPAARDAVGYVLLSTAEEVLELLGATLFLYALLRSEPAESESASAE